VLPKSIDASRQSGYFLAARIQNQKHSISNFQRLLSSEPVGQKSVRAIEMTSSVASARLSPPIQSKPSRPSKPNRREKKMQSGVGKKGRGTEGKKGKEWKKTHQSQRNSTKAPSNNLSPPNHSRSRISYNQPPQARTDRIRGFPLQQPTYSHRRPADARSNPPSCHPHSNPKP
jgi:hypothetical protein